MLEEEHNIEGQFETCQVFVHRDPATAKGRKGGKDDKGEEEKEDREEVT